MSTDVYSQLLMALVMPDRQGPSCYPVRISAAGAITTLLDVSFFSSLICFVLGCSYSLFLCFTTQLLFSFSEWLLAPWFSTPSPSNSWQHWKWWDWEWEREFHLISASQFYYGSWRWKSCSPYPTYCLINSGSSLKMVNFQSGTLASSMLIFLVYLLVNNHFYGFHQTIPIT